MSVLPLASTFEKFVPGSDGVVFVCPEEGHEMAVYGHYHDRPVCTLCSAAMVHQEES